MGVRNCSRSFVLVVTWYLPVVGAAAFLAAAVVALVVVVLLVLVALVPIHCQYELSDLSVTLSLLWVSTFFIMFHRFLFCDV